MALSATKPNIAAAIDALPCPVCLAEETGGT